MRFFRKYFIFLMLFVFLGLLVVNYFLDKNAKLVSPVLGISKSRLSDNIWFPKEVGFLFFDTNSVPNISAKAAFFVEAQSGEVLYEKNIHDRLPIASLTKIMTAIVTLENRNLNDQLLISSRAAATEPDKMLLIGGELLTVEELLQGLFLVSANDASEALAEEVTGRREEFINLMNSKAVQLGMKDSYFVNPSGLEEAEPQYSSAFDVLLMSKYAISKWPELVNITSQPHIYIPRTDNHQDYDLYSGINLVTTYPGVIGFKTGYTPQAELTLVTLARNDNKEVLGVILGSTDRRDDAKKLLDYSFKKLGVKIKEEK